VTDGDREFLARVKRALDADADGLDALAASRLARARHRALDRIDGSRRAPGGLIPAGVFAAGLTTAVILSQLSGGAPAEFHERMLEFELAVPSESIELIEELEFYEWLQANGYTG
jgi:hypothetical protein